MFDISGWDFLVLAGLAVILFGPDRLPKIAADAGRMIRMVRGHVHNARTDLLGELPPELSDMRMSDLTPRGILRKTLGEDPFDELRHEVNSFAAPLPTPTSPPLRANEIPPYDPETT